MFNLPIQLPSVKYVESFSRHGQVQTVTCLLDALVMMEAGGAPSNPLLIEPSVRKWIEDD